MSEEKVTLSDGKEAARQQILDLVAEYCDKYHNQKKEFTEGQRIPYASRVYDNHEMVNLVDSALEFWLTSGACELPGRQILFPCKLRFLREPDRIYGADFPIAGRAPGVPRR